MYGVYYHHCVRSACGNDRGGGAVAGAPDARAAPADVGFSRPSGGLSNGSARPGPCGAAMKRGRAASSCSARLTDRGVPCDVIAPALIPRRARGSHQDGSTRRGPARGAVSRGGADRHPHSDRAGGSGARSPALSGRHPCRSPAGPASALQVSPAPRAALHGDQEGVVEAA